MSNKTRCIGYKNDGLCVNISAIRNSVIYIDSLWWWSREWKWSDLCRSHNRCFISMKSQIAISVNRILRNEKLWVFPQPKTICIRPCSLDLRLDYLHYITYAALITIYSVLSHVWNYIFSNNIDTLHQDQHMMHLVTESIN